MSSQRYLGGVKAVGNDERNGIPIASKSRSMSAVGVLNLNAVLSIQLFGDGADVGGNIEGEEMQLLQLPDDDADVGGAVEGVEEEVEETSNRLADDGAAVEEVGVDGDDEHDVEGQV